MLSPPLTAVLAIAGEGAVRWARQALTAGTTVEISVLGPGWTDSQGLDVHVSVCLCVFAFVSVWDHLQLAGRRAHLQRCISASRDPLDVN